MIEVLEFIFQDFWHWAGMLVLLSVTVSPLGGALINITMKQHKGDEK